jgi:hypothetical protein
MCGDELELIRYNPPEEQGKTSQIVIEVACPYCGYRPALGTDTVLRSDVDLTPHRSTILNMIASGATHDTIIATFAVTAWTLQQFLTHPDNEFDTKAAAQMSAANWMDRGFNYLTMASEFNAVSVTKAKALAEHCTLRAKLMDPKVYAEKPASANVQVNVQVNPFAEAMKNLLQRGSAPPIRGEYRVVSEEPARLQEIQPGSRPKCRICEGMGCSVCR